MIEAYILFNVKKRKGMWGFWMREASHRKVKEGMNSEKGLAYADECQMLSWEKLSSSCGDNFTNGNVLYKKEHLYYTFSR